MRTIPSFIHSFIPAKPEVHLIMFEKLNSYLKQNTAHLRYNSQLFNSI